jgi:uncharacterized membrane protein YkoI
MKINRWIALAAMALLVIGAMGFLSYSALAVANTSQAAQEGEIEGAGEADDSDVGEAEGQGEDETGAQDANEASEANGQDQPDEVAPAKTGVTSAEAQAIVEAANPGATALAVEFDREGGRDLWEVELDNGVDVVVDASSGAILYTDTRD